MLCNYRFQLIIRNSFWEGHDHKFYIKIFGIYWSINLWKNRGGYFCLSEMRSQMAKVLQHPKCLSLPDYRVSRRKCQYVSCKISFPNSSGVHSRVDCTVSAESWTPDITLGPLFIPFCDMMKCLFLHRCLLLYSLSCEQVSWEQVSLVLVAVEVVPLIFSSVLQSCRWHHCLIVLCRLDKTP